MRDYKNILIYSFLISLCAHFFLYTFSSFYKIPGIYTQIDRIEKFFNIKALKEEPREEKTFSGGEKPSSIETVKFEAPNPGMAKAPAIKPEAGLDEARKTYSPIDKIERAMAVKHENEWANLIKNSPKSDELMVKKQERTPQKTMIDLGQIEPQTMVRGPQQVIGTGTVETSDAFYDRMPGFTPQLRAAGQEINRQNLATAGESAEQAMGIAQGGEMVIQRKIKSEDIEKHLKSLVKVYQDPRDGQKYFQVIVRIEDEILEMPTVPKEVVFLLDCSSSIREERFNQFKKGILYCLKHLGPDDRFNIGAFKKNVTWLHTTSIPPREGSIISAEKFLEGLDVKQRTDAYEALYESLQKKSSMHPSYIIFFSDGHPTSGQTDPIRIIGDISQLNQGERPIFAISGGIGVDRYFLDFISYKNRGWTEYSDRDQMIEEKVSEFYEKIKTPLLFHLKYMVSGLKEDAVFPKLLPDFFRNVEFTLYGRYADEAEFSIQLMGEVDGQRKVFINKYSLKDATDGGDEIARNWAFNKVYHLIGELEADRDNVDLMKQINELSQKFKIRTPYFQ